MNKLDKIIANLDKGVKVASVDAYINLPAPERTTTVWFWPSLWYVMPNSLPCNFGGEGFLSQWDELDDFLKIQFPIQHFIRHDVDLFISVKSRQIFEFWYPIKCYFRPQNKNLRKLIPNTHKCNDLIIEDVLIESFLSTITPDTIDCWKNDEYSEHWRNKAIECEGCRTYFLIVRKLLQDAVDSAWTNLPKSGDYETKYGELNKAEKELDDSDSKWLTWVVENRKILD